MSSSRKVAYLGKLGEEKFLVVSNIRRNGSLIYELTRAELTSYLVEESQANGPLKIYNGISQHLVESRKAERIPIGEFLQLATQAGLKSKSIDGKVELVLT